MTTPRDVTEALRDGGLPASFSANQLHWLATRHSDLALARGGPHDKYDAWRLRWAYTCLDILDTINQRPR